MTLPRRRFLQLTAAAATLPGLPDAALAQTYPSRTVRIIVATAAGGTTDLAARLIAQSLSDKLGQAFVVENRTGGSNNIGTEAAAHAAPDGYTLFMANSVNAINTSMYSNLTFNFSTDLAPIAVAMKSVLVLQVHPSVPVKTLSEFIAYAKANPGKINMGSGGKGSTGAMCGELFQLMAGVKFQHVPYRGESLAMADLIGGQVQMVVATVGSSIQYIKAGQVRAIAITSAQRTDALPDLPPIGDTLPGYEATSWSGLMAPKGTPAEIVGKLNREVNASLADPKIIERFIAIGGPPTPDTPAAFGHIIAADTEKWAKVVKATGAKANEFSRGRPDFAPATAALGLNTVIFSTDVPTNPVLLDDSSRDGVAATLGCGARTCCISTRMLPYA
jgi:tripartite-type tricarboxylate transporter receptor subunit TctC